MAESSPTEGRVDPVPAAATPDGLADALVRLVERGRAAEYLTAAVGPDLARLKDELKADVLDLDSGVEHLRTETRALKDLLQAVDGRTRPEAIAAKVSEEVSGAVGRLEGIVTDVQARLDLAKDTLGRFAIHASPEAIAAAVRKAAEQVAKDTFEPLFAERIERLGASYEQADEHLSQLRKLVDNYGPGGLPVLQQQNEVLRQQAVRLQSDLDSTQERLTGVERELFQLRATSGVASAQNLQQRMEELARRESAVAEREALEADHQRLLRENRQLSERLTSTLASERQAETERLDRQEYERLLRFEQTTTSELHVLEGRLQSAVTSSRESTARARALEEQLRAASLIEAAALERDARLQKQEEEIKSLTNELEKVRSAWTERRQAVEQQVKTISSLRDELLRTKAKEATARSTWQAEQQESMNLERQRLETTLSQWAEGRAKELAAAAQAQLTAALADRSSLEAQLQRLQASAGELPGLRHEVKRLEAERDAERDALQAYKSTLDRQTQELQALARAQAEELVTSARGKVSELQAELLRIRQDVGQSERELHGLDGRKGALAVEIEALQHRRDEVLTLSPRERRLAQLHVPVFQKLEEVGPALLEERAWLDGVADRIAQAGFTFDPRVLAAFHTALKIGKHAPITVLGGISGTGKSELPRLYCDAGGIPFLPIPVQPSWDSPADLFGFFNYSDSRFKAEPLARLLAQINAPDSALREGPVLVMLDEMNLARVEYYFAELLSRLEARRGIRANAPEAERDRAAVFLDAGAGEPAERLYLDERIMFVGTMNEDESTLTLTDKVLDRASLISFPSPREMSYAEQRDIAAARVRLSAAAWKAWTVTSTNAEIGANLNKINQVMETLGRPFGHRLFRAIHAYVANYPHLSSVKDPMEAAWSDQWSMKILPRLKGLECQDRQVSANLERLQGLLPAELVETFDQVRGAEFFAWRGARAVQGSS